jgi:hypothetical protein
MNFVIIIQFFPISCWLRRLANVHWPLLGKILQFTEQGFKPLQDKIFSHLLDLTILNSFILSCENVTSLCITMEHAARNQTPALSSTISRLEEASGHWLISSAIRMYVMCAVWTGRKRASISASYCIRTLYYWFCNVFYLYSVFV